ncbi:MAG: autotransporter domain-containing protein [Paenalcaligenes sp.]
MNRIYRVIFNRKLGLWQVASERSRGCKKSSGRVAKVAAALLLLGTSGSAFAWDSIVVKGDMDSKLPPDHNGRWELPAGLAIREGVLEVRSFAQVRVGETLRLGPDEPLGNVYDLKKSKLLVTGLFSELSAKTIDLRGGETSLVVENGGKVQSGTVFLDGLGFQYTALGLVRGEGSALQVDGELSILGNGKLVLQDRAEVKAQRIRLDSWREYEIDVFSIGLPGGSMFIGAASSSPAEAVAAGGVQVGEVLFDAPPVERFVTHPRSFSQHLVFNHTNSDYAFRAVLRTNGHRATDKSAVISHVAGTTLLTADNSDFHGFTVVSGGKLIVQKKLGGMAEVTGGTLQYGDAHNKVANAAEGDLSVSGQGSTLSIFSGSTLRVDGKLEMQDGTQLSIGMGGAETPLTANEVSFGDNVALNINALSKSMQKDAVIVQSNSVIAGKLPVITIGGAVNPVDYLQYDVQQSPNNMQYLLSYGLRWEANNDAAHGTFTLVDAGNRFDLGVSLVDQVANPLLNWDGVTLTKTGLGTLALHGNNSYSGDTIVKEGALEVSRDANLGGPNSSIQLHRGAVLVTKASFASTRDLHLTGASLDVAEGTELIWQGLITATEGFTKVGKGVLAIAGNSPHTFTGNTFLVEGKLEVVDNLAGATTVQGGKLVIQPSAVMSVKGELALTNQARLELGTGAEQPILEAESLFIAQDVVLHVNAEQPVGFLSEAIRTTNGIQGDFSSITVSGFKKKKGADDYDGTLNTRISEDGYSFEMFEDMSWTANNNWAHGTFTVKKDDFVMLGGFDLGDEKANPSLGWNGKTLTKKGAGILEFDEDSINTYSGGTIIQAGEIFVSRDENLGAATGAVTLEGGTLVAMESFASARDVRINNKSGIRVEKQKNTTTTLQLTGTLAGTSVLTKTGQGSLIISGNNSGFTGGTVVSKGTLIVLGTAGSQAEVTGGATLQYGNGTQGAANTLQTDLSVKGGNSTLSIQGPATLTVQGQVDLAKNTKLALGVGSSGTALQAKGITIGTGVGFTLSGVSTATSTDTVLIDTANGITGDFASISVGGFTQGPVDYMTLNTRKSADGKQYLASHGLSWTANNNLRAGTFTLVDASEQFTVGVDLTDQAANKATGWDGKILTKAGAGTLVLGGANSYTGDTIVQGGTVSVSNDSNLGAASSTVVLDGGGLASTASFSSARNVTLNQAAHMDVAANTELSWQGAISGAGGLTKTGAGTLVLDSANSYAGVTTLAAGTVQINADSALGTATSVIVDGGGLASTASFSSMRTMALNQTGHMDVAANTELNWQGAISGAGGLTKTGAGTLVLDRANSYAGVTTLTAGTVQIDADSALGTANSVAFSGGGLATTASFTSARDFNLNKAGTIDVATGTTLGVTGTVAGAGDLRKTGQGTLQLTNTANAYGNTLVQEGTVEASSASISGSIANAGTVILNEAADVSFTGHVLALNNQAGQMIKQGQGHLTLAGQSALDWHIEAGQVSSAAERFTGNAEIDAGASLALNQAVAAHYAGQLSGAGSLQKQGQGLLQLTGDSSAFTGSVTIEAGRLAVNGKLGGSQTVGNGAFLGGNGTIGSGVGSTLTVAQGGTLSPGNSIGTLTIDGDLALQTGSRFDVEVDPQSTAADLVHVTGNASLAGGVAHIGENGNYNLRSTYTILSADGSLSGRFDTVQSDFAFLTPELNYDYSAGNVQLALRRNSTSFASLAETRNQRATATAIDSMGVGAGHAVYDALAQLPNDVALLQSSLNALSGEIHASTKTALIDDSRFIRDAATDRLRGAFGAAGSSASPVLANQQVVNANTAGAAAWLQLFGNWGHSDSDGNAHKLKRRTNGFMLGADTSVGDNWRVGAMAGYSHTKSDVRDIGGSNKSDNYHVGVYGGGQWDAVGVRLGAAHSWHDMRTNRSVAMPGLSEELKASPKARTTQIFADVGYNVDAGVMQLEPFANLAYVNLHSQSFSEKGGAAALKSSSQNNDSTFMTLGSRLSADIAVGETNVMVSASAGWRHAFGSVLPKATQRFSSGEAFTITGVPLSRDSAVLEAGVAMQLSRSVNVGVSYQGQLGSDAKYHGVRANVGIAF